jgi:glutathione synthase/RimK-type ligase-like ATP-grasp enzyme
MLFAKQFKLALHNMGIKTFPDVNTSWHFDDKLGQKYLLEAIGAPLVPSYAFYTPSEAMDWAKVTDYPKVFKLRGGASSVNVKLVTDAEKAFQLIRKAFSSGFRYIDRKALVMDKIHQFQRTKSFKKFLEIMPALRRLLIPSITEKMLGRQKGYIYFQDFIPDNGYDTRLFVIGNKCFGTRRFNRKNDFRASGSKLFETSKELFDPEVVKLAFGLADKLDIQSVAFDFLIQNGNYLLVEISYCFPPNDFANHPGYFDRDLVWHEAEINPSVFIIEEFLGSFSKN